MSTKIVRLIRSSEVISWVATIAFCFTLWLLLSATPSTSFYIPSPLAVGSILVNQADVFLKHTTYTAASAVLGFIYGAIAALTSTLIAILWQPARRGLSLFAIVLYSMPLIAAAPLAALLFGSNNSGIVLGCIGAYLPIFLSGLRAGDRTPNTFNDLLRGYGATTWNEIRCIRLPLVARGWIIGAQSGWTWAVLGALLGDFTGGRWGLGTFLVGSLVRGEPSRVWAIVVLCLALSVAGLIVIRGLGRFFRLHSSVDPLDASFSVVPDGGTKLRNARFNWTHIVVCLLAWQFGAWVVSMEGGVFVGPLDLFLLALEIYNGQAAFSYEYILSAFCSTWLLSFTGVALSLLLAFAVAAGQHLVPLLSRPIVVIILITQVTPIVAFVPLIAFYLGRGHASVVAIVVLSTIYPSYTVFLRALEEVPQSALDIIRGFGGGATSEFIKVRVPHAAWMTVVALRLAVGRALLGAITAEYLLTGNGLGGILGQTRALLDFRIVWFVCLLVAIVTLLTYLISSVFKKALQSMLMVQGESEGSYLK